MNKVQELTSELILKEVHKQVDNMRSEHRSNMRTGDIEEERVQCAIEEGFRNLILNHSESSLSGCGSIIQYIEDKSMWHRNILSFGNYQQYDMARTGSACIAIIEYARKQHVSSKDATKWAGIVYGAVAKRAFLCLKNLIGLELAMLQAGDRYREGLKEEAQTTEEEQG